MRRLRKESGRSKRRIYEMIDDTRKKHKFAISKETAAYLVAADYGIDISKEVSVDELGKVREVSRIQQPVAEASRSFSSKRGKTQPINMQIGQLRIEDIPLPKKLVEEANDMSKVYPVVYLFENSIRQLILSVMQKKHGQHWWSSKAPLKARQKVEERKRNEDKNRWHCKRGSHDAYYTDIDDLTSIITNNWEDFKYILPSMDWVRVKISEIEQSRNVIAHNNPLAKRDRDRINVDFLDWVSQVGKFIEPMTGSAAAI